MSGGSGRDLHIYTETGLVRDVSVDISVHICSVEQVSYQNISLLTDSARTTVLRSQIPPVSVCAHTDSGSTTRDGRAPHLPIPTFPASQMGEAEEERTRRAAPRREEPLLEQREGRGCCGGRMGERLGPILIHTYTQPGEMPSRTCGAPLLRSRQSGKSRDATTRTLFICWLSPPPLGGN